MLIISFSINPLTPYPSCCINEGGVANIRKAHRQRPFTYTENILIIRKTSVCSWRARMMYYHVLLPLPCLLVMRSAAQCSLAHIQSGRGGGNVRIHVKNRQCSCQATGSQQPTDVTSPSFNLIWPFRLLLRGLIRFFQTSLPQRAILTGSISCILPSYQHMSLIAVFLG